MLQIEKPIAVVFDDHLLFAESFSTLLERLKLFRTVRAFRDEGDFIRFLTKNYNIPLYLFLDYYLPESNALTLINDTRRLNKKARVVVISSVMNPTIVNHILTYQPQGFISKSCGLDTVMDCLNAIARNETYICPVIQEVIDNQPSIKSNIPFTARELEMLQYFAKGLSIANTAKITNLSKHTIVAHRRKMMNKVNTKSITELLAYARRQGLI